MKTKKTEQEFLYQKLKNVIYENIFKGVYANHSLIPPERELALRYGMSRITVRNTLEILEREGLITRVQGRGTAVSLKTCATRTDMGIIALVAPNKIPFFSSFVEAFSEKAEKGGSLVLIKTQSENKNFSLEKYLYKLFVRNVRNAVLWLHDCTVSMECIARLRGMGMNFVFFDIMHALQYGDGVCLDNQHAIESLYQVALEQAGNSGRIAYLGWGETAISSITEREHAFVRCSGHQSPVYHVPWAVRWNFIPYLSGFLSTIEKKLPSVFICVNSEIGIATRKILNERGFSEVVVCCVDEDHETASLGLTTIDQNLGQMAGKVMTCLKKQNHYPLAWKPRLVRIKGTLIRR